MHASGFFHHRTLVWNVPVLFRVSSQSLTNSLSRPHPGLAPLRLPGSSSENSPLVSSLSCLQKLQPASLCLPRERAMLQISVPPKPWLGRSKMLSQILGWFGEGQRAEAKHRGPRGRVCPGPQMRTLKGTHICLPIQLLSPSESVTVTSPWNVSSYIRNPTYQLGYRFHLSKRPFFCLRWPKSLAPMAFLRWPALLAPFACGRRVHQKTKKAPETCGLETREPEVGSWDAARAYCESDGL